MNTYIALLRGINVGGRGLLPMKELVALLEGIGCREVRTYIQSGNVVFQHGAKRSALAGQIQATIAAAKGFEPMVLVLTPQSITRAVAANPLQQDVDDPAKVHLLFLAAEPDHPDLDALEALRSPTESFALGQGVFYLHAPDGIGRSKLAAGIERTLGVPVTARNGRTVQRILDLSH